jgi:hypothetical protein
MASVRQIVLDEIVGDWRGKWLVLRCANKNTLALVAALTRVGLRAWTPMWVRRRMALPCLPSFVFLAEADAVMAIDAKERSGAPSFSLMKSYGVLVRIKDADLASLRAEVADLNPCKENAIVWPAIGSEQKIISGAFQGLIGKVIGRTQHHCLVDIGNKKFPSVKIPPFLLADLDA